MQEYFGSENRLPIKILLKHLYYSNSETDTNKQYKIARGKKKEDTRISA